MADAKFVVEDHRNGDAKIELDANKRQFTGLSKEELMKYAEDPFWVNLRWFMFVFFWALWVCMLAGAITIIVKAPKCPAPTPKTWFEKGPLVESGDATHKEILPKLPNLKTLKVQGIFMDVPTYDYKVVPVIDNFKSFVGKAKEYGIRVIVDLIPNYVSIDHDWFNKSMKREHPYTDYFVWKDGGDYKEDGEQRPPNGWLSTENTSAWKKNEVRGQFYLHQYGESQPDLNFDNPDVIKEFESALRAWMTAGAAGVRLNKVRQLLVNASHTPDEAPADQRGLALGADHTQYSYYQHQHTSDLPQLNALLVSWSDLVAATSDTPGETVFTMAEEGGRMELYRLRSNLSNTLRPPSAVPLTVARDVSAAATAINDRLAHWSAIQLVSSPEHGEQTAELAALALLLPATPVLELRQLLGDGNDTTKSEFLSHVAALREDASVAHGRAHVRAVPAVSAAHAPHAPHTLLACARWKLGQSGYVGVYNPLEEEQRANLTALPSVPEELTVHYVSDPVKLYTNYTSNHAEFSDNVLVPPKSTVILSYVPKTAVEN